MLTEEQLDFQVDGKVKFLAEKTPYRIWAVGQRFIVCTRPFNPQRTVLYTIIDLKREVRGPENLIFGSGAETKELCEEMLKRLEAGESEVTYRNYLDLDIEWVQSKIIEGRKGEVG